MKKPIFIIILSIVCVLSYSQTESKNDIASETIRTEAQNPSINISDEATIYKIENDILEKMYTAQFNTINLIITIVLGVFGILGFFGIRSIFTLKNSYEKELSDFRSLKKQFEKDYNAINSKNEKLDEQITKVVEVNEAQNTRLKVLEIKEKAANYMKNGQYRAAIEYLNIANELDPKDANVIELRGSCFWQLKQYNDAINNFVQILDLGTDDSINHATNLMELYLITKQIDKYEKILERYISEAKEHKQNVILYLEIFKFFQLQKTDELKTHIKDLIKDDTHSDFRNIGWRFKEVNSYLNEEEQKNNPNYELFTSFLKYLVRKLPIDNLNELLTA